MRTGRPRVKIGITPQEETLLQEALSNQNARVRDKARLILTAREKSLSICGLSELLGRSTKTVQRWFTKWKTGGSTMLMTDTRGPGRPPKVDIETQKELSYQNFWVYGAMELTRGASEFAFMPYTSKGITSVFLNQISQSEPEAQHIVVWDGAGFHQEDQKPENIYLIKLPAYSPELSPQEKLWDILKDRVANTIYKDIEELMDRATEGLRPYFENPERVLRLIVNKYQWILKANSIY